MSVTVHMADHDIEIGDKQAEAFLQEKLLIQLDSTHYQSLNDEALVYALEHRLEFLICDFCSAEEVTWAFPATDFMYQGAARHGGAGPTHGSMGDWGACDLCASYIMNNNLDALSKHSLDHFISKNPHLRVAKKDIEKALRGLHREFMRHRVGAPRNIAAQSFIEIVTKGHLDHE